MNQADTPGTSARGGWPSSSIQSPGVSPFSWCRAGCGMDCSAPPRTPHTFGSDSADPPPSQPRPGRFNRGGQDLNRKRSVPHRTDASGQGIKGGPLRPGSDLGVLSPSDMTQPGPRTRARACCYIRLRSLALVASQAGIFSPSRRRGRWAAPFPNTAFRRWTAWPGYPPVSL